MKKSVLGSIKSPDDLKKLNSGELQNLCDEIRRVIIDTVSKNGGHLASSLGAVELTVALHRTFNAPRDSIIFDVGHQSYAHKIITGRLDEFATLRKKGGISGFMRPGESEYDPFVTGHSSNSVSAAYGIYKANVLSGSDAAAVAVIGDGAMTGGMAYEALNNVGGKKGKFIIVLNDNKMSISRNVGAISRSFLRMRNGKGYHKIKFAVANTLLKLGAVGRCIYFFFYKLKDAVKGLIFRNNFFVAMGFNYLGPVDGHNITAMESIFKIAKEYDRPTVIHIVTKKGKGYSYAESSPDDYHGVSAFDIKEGAANAVKTDFSAVAGQTLVELATKSSKICAITAAMTYGTGLYEFSKAFRERFFDVGIAEEHAVTFAAGLAKGGMVPYFAVYSSFLQRGYDQVLHDAAIAGLPVRLLVDRAGIVGEDGESHQGVFDVAFLSTIPNMNIYSPYCYEELKYRIRNSAECDELCAIRYPRGVEKLIKDVDYSGDYTVVGKNKSKLVITYGRIFSFALEAQDECDNFDIIKLNKVFPLSEEVIDIISKYKYVHFFEEGIRSGGIGEHIAGRLVENRFGGEYHIHAIDGCFVAHQTTAQALSAFGLDKPAIIRAMESI